MKKIIVNGVCASLVCFCLSSFTANSNNLAGTNPAFETNTPLQDTTTKKMNSKMKSKKMDKMDKMDKTTDKKMDTSTSRMKKKPA